MFPIGCHLWTPPGSSVLGAHEGFDALVPFGLLCLCGINPDYPAGWPSRRLQNLTNSAVLGDQGGYGPGAHSSYYELESQAKGEVRLRGQFPFQVEGRASAGEAALFAESGVEWVGRDGLNSCEEEKTIEFGYIGVRTLLQ